VCSPCLGMKRVKHSRLVEGTAPMQPTTRARCPSQQLQPAFLTPSASTSSVEAVGGCAGCGQVAPLQVASRGWVGGCWRLKTSGGTALAQQGLSCSPPGYSPARSGAPASSLEHTPTAKKHEESRFSAEEHSGPSQ